MQQFKEEEITEPIPIPTLKEGTPTIFMLRYLKILDPVVSRNQKKISLDMAKIGDSAPNTKWKVNLMESI